jgi:hypothetical protein
MDFGNETGEHNVCGVGSAVAEVRADEGCGKSPKEAEPKPNGKYSEIVDGVVWNYKVKKGKSTVLKSSPNGAVAIPPVLGGRPVAAIGAEAFKDCYGLTSVTIPDSVTSIGNYAFFNCVGLTSATIGNGVTSIGEGAFYNCGCLSSVTIPGSVKDIGMGAFVTGEWLDAFLVSKDSKCFETLDGALFSKGGKTIIACPTGKKGHFAIPDSVTSIAAGAFANCSGLASVTIPNSVTSIGEGAFFKCGGLTSVTIPGSVKDIGERAFVYCDGLTSVVIGIGVTSIGANAFSGCKGLASVTIPDSVTSIGEGAFSKCDKLDSATREWLKARWPKCLWECSSR